MRQPHPRVGRVGTGNRSAEEQGQKSPGKTQNTAENVSDTPASGVRNGTSLARAALHLHVHPSLSAYQALRSQLRPTGWGSVTV